MKINGGKEIEVASNLILSAGDEDLRLVDKRTVVKVKTNNAEFAEIIEGYFGYVDDETIYVGDEIIPIKCIDDIEILDI